MEKHEQIVKIKTNEENPEPIELVVEEIIKVSEAFQRIGKSRAKKELIVLLLHDAVTGVRKTDIRKILDVAPCLAEIYLKPK
ncbi:hypothetical protein [Candidatus Manganitrophus noduliformans]|uniref:Uncharacterized protein n=1 Tax=Candidatus Manganitrophus noduliformans TaxID=2606439 RepID=A0A7X6DME1_9BACT|nr:hypothetical protein [Candidatus Manganitrophus noduliformans]NKE69855.1 hypothetical protein [Candidatus Manganitrophus noduliformans]